MTTIPTDPGAREAWLAEQERIIASIHECCQCDGCHMGRSRLATAMPTALKMIREQAADIVALAALLKDGWDGNALALRSGEIDNSPNFDSMDWITIARERAKAAEEKQ